MDDLGTAKPVRMSFSDSEAAQTFVALRYWSRATQYEISEPEKAVLSACEARSVQYARMGLFAGGSAGLLIGAVSRQMSMLSKLSVGCAGASGASMYGQYKANAPCLHDLFELKRQAHSPLAEQASAIMREGTAATVERLHIQARKQQAERLPASAPSVAPMGSSATDEHAQLPTSGALSPTPRARAPLAAHDNEATDSWEAVRQRYQARLAGDQQPPSVAEAPSAATHESPLLEASQGEARRVVRRNAYGDEIV